LGEEEGFSEEEEEERPGAYGSFEEEAVEDEEEEDDDGQDDDAPPPAPAPSSSSVASLGGLAYAALARLRAEALVRRALELRDASDEPVEVVLLAPPTLAAAVREALAEAG
jgi:hypothetical protein